MKFSFESICLKPPITRFSASNLSCPFLSSGQRIPLATTKWSKTRVLKPWNWSQSFSSYSTSIIERNVALGETFPLIEHAMTRKASVKEKGFFVSLWRFWDNDQFYSFHLSAKCVSMITFIDEVLLVYLWKKPFTIYFALLTLRNLLKRGKPELVQEKRCLCFLFTTKMNTGKAVRRSQNVRITPEKPWKAEWHKC